MNQIKFIPAITLMAVLTFAIISAVGLMTVEAKTVTGNGYTFEAPNGWKVKNRDNRFTSMDATLSYDKGGKSASVGIEHGDAFTDIGVEQLEMVVGKVYETSSIFESGDDNPDFMSNNETLPYAIVHITEKNLFGYGVESVLLMVGVPLGDSDGLLVQYKTSEKNFDKLLGQVEGIIKSIKPTTNL